MGRAYLRVDPAMFERKVIQQGYPPLAYAAYSAILCLADGQPVRGRFRDERVLRALLGPLARWLPFLIEHRDLVPAAKHRRCDNCPSAHGAAGQLYVDGWDEWQEGDWQVKERLARVRDKDRNGLHGGDRIESHGPGRSASAIAESVVARRSEAESGAPLRAPRSMTDDERTAAVAENRELLGNADDVVQRAALRTLHRLEPGTDWEAERLAILATQPPATTARPRGSADA
jgi:hypothetical protein